MRGKLVVTSCGASLDGITPADAGKTSPGIVSRGHTGDHPRGCGENSAHSKSGDTVPGSPPRMRGKLYDCTLFPKDLRITPADAGKTV